MVQLHQPYESNDPIELGAWASYAEENGEYQLAYDLITKSIKIYDKMNKNTYDPELYAASKKYQQMIIKKKQLRNVRNAFATAKNVAAGRASPPVLLRRPTNYGGAKRKTHRKRYARSTRNRRK
jgi:hypothetical protein